MLDGQQPRVTAFDTEGKVRWIYARQGEGPGELASTIDALETADGLWVVDGRGRRIVLLSERGEFVRQIPVPDLARLPSGIVAAGDGEAVLLDGSSLFRIALADGSPTGGPTPVPWTRAPPTAWPKLTRAAGAGAVVAVGMIYGPDIVVLDGGLARAGIVNDSVPYQMRENGPPPGGGMWIPQLSSMRVGAATMRLVDDELWVLTGGDFGDPERPNEVVVSYSLDGARLGELALPVGALDFVATADRLYVLPDGQDVPTLYAFERLGR